MSTHGSLLVKTEEYAFMFPGGILLNTTHTGMMIPEVVRQAPLLLLANRPYIDCKKAWFNAHRSDGSLDDWLFYPTCVVSLLIAAKPMFLTPVMNNRNKNALAKWSGADNPEVLVISNDHDRWLYTPHGEETEIIRPYDIIMDFLPERKVD